MSEAVRVILRRSKELQNTCDQTYKQTLAAAEEVRKVDLCIIDSLNTAAREICEHTIETREVKERAERCSHPRDTEEYTSVTCDTCGKHLRNE